MSGIEQPPGRIPSSPRGPDTASDDAARWLLALDEAGDDRDLRARFDAWLAADPSHAAAWRDTAEVYELIGHLPPAGGGHRAAAVFAHRRPRRVRAFALACAAVVVAAAVLLVAAPELRLRLQADHVTQAGEQRDVTLADGSAVRLGPSSALASRFDGSRRRVDLLKGAAFFDVTPDLRRPFQVSAGSVRATAIGTAFEVRIAGDVVVSVEDGIVDAASDDGGSTPPERLGVGDWARFGATAVERGRARPEEIAAWRRGRLVVRDRPLAAVVDELRPYHRGAIVLTDQALGRRRVSGVYDTSDPVGAIRAVVAAHGGTVRTFSPWLVVLSGS